MYNIASASSRFSTLVIIVAGLSAAAATTLTTAATPGALLAGVSVREFGAVGDGQTDDTRAIQAALDTGRKVVIPEGTFLITNALEPSAVARRASTVRNVPSPSRMV